MVELAASGAYVAVNVSVPTASAPADRLIVATPAVSDVAAVKFPQVSVIDPVGIGLSAPPLTVTVTLSDCAVVMLVGDGVTVTVGVVAGADVTKTVFVPVAER